jgi:hypothetical protein
MRKNIVRGSSTSVIYLTLRKAGVENVSLSPLAYRPASSGKIEAPMAPGTKMYREKREWGME